MSYQAIDLALIPSSQSLNQLIEWSKHPALSPERLKLNKIDAVPHLTLAIGLVAETALADLWQSVLELKPSSPLVLQATSIYQAETAAGRVVGLNYSCPEALQALHEDVWSLVEPMVSYESDDYEIYTLAKPDLVDPITLNWVKNFKNGTIANYQPHITLGFDPGDGSSESFLAGLLGSEVALDRISCYQLGSYCTCCRLIQDQFIGVHP